jgi:hypothetical protein
MAVYIRLILDLFAYVDDSYSWDFASNLTFYSPYSKHLPAKQAFFLTLLDEVGVPHEERNQIFGPRIHIIGFTVDANATTIEMPLESRQLLVSAIRAFANPKQRRNTPRLPTHGRMDQLGLKCEPTPQTWPLEPL